MCRRGFTLIELIVVIGIVAVLIALLLPSLAGARDAGEQTDELTRLRQVGMAWTMYSSSFNDRILPGYVAEDVQEQWRMSTRIRYDNTSVPRNLAAPYPWRLLSFMDENHLMLMKYHDEAPPVPSEAIELVANQPGYGYNALYLGGWYEGYNAAEGRYIVKFEASNVIARGVAELRRAGEIIVFAPSTPRAAGQSYTRVRRNVPGAHFIVPPIIAQTPQWSGASGAFEVFADAPTPAPRWTSQVPALFADGHTASEGAAALTDQRRWIPRANAADFTHAP